MTKKHQPININLESTVFPFIILCEHLHDGSDKDRLKKIKGMIDTFFNLLDKDEGLTELMKIVSEPYASKKKFMESMREKRDFYQQYKSKKERKQQHRFIKASVLLYYQIIDVFNRMDILEIAYIFRENEYDYSVSQITQNLENSNFTTKAKLHKYLMYNNVNCNNVSMDSKGYWGKKEEIGVEEIEQESETSDTTISLYKINRGRGRKYSTSHRLEWGVNKLHGLIKQYKRDYGIFYHQVEVPPAT